MKQKNEIIKEYIKTLVSNSCDVLVCGGGFAGISAALSAARHGKKVILVEKEYLLGGLGTAGLITIYLPLCDGFGKQVSFGIAEELFRLSISLGAEADYPENWLDSNDVTKRTEKDKRFQVRYNPHIFSILAEKLLLENGVEILYGTYAVSVNKKKDKINAVIVENKTGRQAIKVDSVVDATGDCDLALFSGAPTQIFKQGNVLAAWYYSLGSDGYNLNTLGVADITENEKNDETKVPLLAKRRFSGLDGKEISEMVQLSHKSTINDIINKRLNDSRYLPTMIPSIPQIRMTRRIVGEYTLDSSENHKFFEDSIGMVSDWKKRGPIYEVPFSTLYSKSVKNLIVAGRCTSVTDSMWDIMRVIPCCAVTGQAAGTAASLTNDFSRLDVKHLQRVLKQDCVKIHIDELEN